MSPETYRVGIDVGGTNTDAVILDSRNRVVAKAKTPTTADVLVGVRNSLALVLDKSQLPKKALRWAMLSTTHCTNAVATRRGLLKIGCIRLGAPATAAIPPLATWPEDLRQQVLEDSCILHGGHELTGEELAPLDEKGIRQFARQMKGRIDAISISAVFSPVNAAHEHRAMEIVRDELGSAIHLTLSHQIGGLGLIERENAAALNAALAGTAKVAVTGFADAVRELGLDPSLYLGQNDGTLISTEDALLFPVLTIASGPANSVRGAAWLSGLRDAVVVDIGGTTTDLGVLTNGFPRESSLAVQIGGIRTNFRMPDLISIALGGGSLVELSGAEVKVGPETVGYHLPQEARVFGGRRLTATDLAVAAGFASIGDPQLVRDLPTNTLNGGLQTIVRLLEHSVDRIKLSEEAPVVVVVGGASFLFPEHLDGAASVIRPADFEVANAVGVCIAQLSATVDQIVDFERLSRELAFGKAQQIARQRIIAAGAEPSTIEIVEMEDIPLPYLPGDSRRIRLKAAANLAM